MRWVGLLTLLSSLAHGGTDYTLASVYGLNITGCAQLAVNSSTQSRTAALTVGKFYAVYCIDSTDFSTGDACRYIQGGASIDVTAIGGSLVGKVIPAGMQDYVYVNTANRYISAISKAGSGTYLETCMLTPLP